MTSSIAAIHVAKKQLGLDDETYRGKLAVITGKSSVKHMTEAEREKVLKVFRKEGFKPAIERRSNGRAKLTGKYAGKLQALWIAGYNLGVFRQRDDAALIKFVQRQTKVDHIRWLQYAEDARKAIEALKAIIARDGGVAWSDTPLMPDYARADGFKIAWAQWLKLGGDSNANSVHLFFNEVIAITGTTVVLCDTRDWQAVMNAFGERIRAAIRRQSPKSAAG